MNISPKLSLFNVQLSFRAEGRVRVLTAVVAIPIVVLITIFAPPAIFAATVAVVSMLAVEEFFSLSIKKGIGRPGRWFLLAIAAVSMSSPGRRAGVLGPAAFAAVMLMTFTL